jgi:hypothetical protein
MRKFIISLAAAAATFAALPGAAQAGRVVTVTYMCDLNGMSARLTAQVEQVGDYGTVGNPGGGLTPIRTGSKIRYAGEVVAQNGTTYRFTGENAYADFTAVGWNERFRVRFDAQGEYLQMTINPENGAQATRHMCRLVR